jgi:hypothetical protein
MDRCPAWIDLEAFERGRRSIIPGSTMRWFI